MENPSALTCLFSPHAVQFFSFCRYKQYLLLLSMAIASLCANAQIRVNDEDAATAEALSRKYKDDDVMCTSSHHYFTFDKGKNTLNDKVVVIEEEAELEFLSLKKFASITYPEFYNKFIELKVFKKAIKAGSRYAVSRMPAQDRSVTSDGVFFDDSRVQYYPIRFSEKGSMARINVKKEYTDGRYLTRLFFGETYPVKEQVFEFKVPEWLTVDFKPINFDGYNIDRQEIKKGGYITYTFTMKDIPASKQEYRSIGHAYTDPHIIIQIKSFESKGETLKGFDKTDDLYAWNNRLYEMAGNKKEGLQYIAYEDGYSGYIPAAAQDVLIKKFGDCKGMANLLTELLKMAGYDAHFTWIGTRSIPYQQSMPALCVNNHAITTLYFQGAAYFLDGTEKYAAFGENAYRIQGKEAMIAKGVKYDLKTVPLTTGNEHKIFSKADFVLTSDVLQGKMKVVLTGNERKDFHQSYQDLPTGSQKDFLNEYLEFGNDNMQAANIKTSDLKNREIPVTIEGDVDLSNYVNTISGDKYISIDFFPKTLERFMPDEKRAGGYDFDDVLTFEDEISLTIPADSKFVDVPEKVELNYERYEFKGEYLVSGNKILLKKRIVIKNSVIKKSDFANWTKFLESIKEFSKYLLSVTKK